MKRFSLLGPLLLIAACGGKIAPVPGESAQASTPSDAPASLPTDVTPDDFCAALAKSAASCPDAKLTNDTFTCMRWLSSSCANVATTYSEGMRAAVSVCADTLACDQPLLENDCVRAKLQLATISTAQKILARELCSACGGGVDLDTSHGLNCAGFIADVRVPWGAFVTALSDEAVSTVQSADCFARASSDGSQFYRCADQFIECAVAQLPGAALRCTR